MHRRRAAILGLALVLAATAGCLDGATAPATNDTESQPPNETTTVVEPPDAANASDYPATVDFFDGEDHVATIYAETATTWRERYTGLSDHESLEDWEGMLFVYDEPDDRTYVMREMSFGIDIVYVDENGCVTSAHAAPEPGPNEDGEEQQYPGYGQYVVEVPMGVATDNGVGEGDPVRLEHEGSVLDGRGDCAASQG